MCNSLRLQHLSRTRTLPVAARSLLVEGQVLRSLAGLVTARSAAAHGASRGMVLCLDMGKRRASTVAVIAVVSGQRMRLPGPGGAGARRPCRFMSLLRFSFTVHGIERALG